MPNEHSKWWQLARVLVLSEELVAVVAWSLLSVMFTGMPWLWSPSHVQLAY